MFSILSKSQPGAVRKSSSATVVAVTVFGDILALCLGLFLVRHFAPSAGTIDSEWQGYARDLGVIALVMLTMFYRGLHDIANRHDSVEYTNIVGAVNFGVLLDLLANKLASLPTYSIDQLIWLWLGSVVLLCGARFASRRLRFSMMRSHALNMRALVVGITEESRWIVRQWTEDKHSGIEPVGFIEDGFAAETEPDTGLPVLGNSNHIVSILKDRHADCVLIARPELIHRQLESNQTIMRTLADVEVFATTGIGDLLTSTVQIRDVAFVPVVQISKRRMSGIHLAAKTLLDYIGTLLFLAIAIWPMLIIAIIIRLGSKGPIIYKHKRLGLNEKPFYMYKFRSMYIDGNERLTPEQKEELRIHMKLKDDPRITPIGGFIRKTSLDELPQLFNVLLGQMSWVGPRPLVEGEPEKFGQYRHLRTTVKPGLTGLWQISGRSDLSYDERVLLDTYYVRNFNFWLDLEILFKTLPALLAKRGAY